jgi:hypothetical protein
MSAGVRSEYSSIKPRKNFSLSQLGKQKASAQHGRSPHLRLDSIVEHFRRVCHREKKTDDGTVWESGGLARAGFHPKQLARRLVQNSNLRIRRIESHARRRPAAKGHEADNADHERGEQNTEAKYIALHYLLD